MSFIFTFRLTCLFFMMPVVVGAVTNEPGKIFNAGFEQGDKLPEGWTTYGDGLCLTLVWDKTTAHTGQRSVYVSNADRVSSGAWITSCKVKENTSYRFAVWIKVKKGKGQGITLLRARGYASGMDKKWEATSEGKGDTGGKWQLLEWVFTTPPGMTEVALWLWNINGFGDQAWFDDVEFTEAAQANSAAKPPAQPAGEKKP